MLSMQTNAYIGERGYMSLMEDIIHYGVKSGDRTGTGTHRLFNAQTMWNVGHSFPFSTVRPAPLRLAFEEWMLFMNGETDTKILEEKGINFWKGNTSREFLDKRGLTHLPEGDMGKAYGYQFRNFNGEVDQLEQVWNGLRDDPYGRRHIVTFWNPAQTHEMALPPCWYEHIFFVEPSPSGDILHIKVNNRSLDAAYGYLFAVQQYAFYLMAMAQSLNMRVGWMVTDHTDVHIYQNAVPFVKETLNRDYGTTGQLHINKILNSLDDILRLKYEDLSIEGLQVNRTPYEVEKPPMAV